MLLQINEKSNSILDSNHLMLTIDYIFEGRKKMIFEKLLRKKSHIKNEEIVQITKGYRIAIFKNSINYSIVIFTLSEKKLLYRIFDRKQFQYFGIIVLSVMNEIKFN